MQDFHESLDLGAVLIALAYGDNVDVRARAVLDEERILRRVELDLHGEVGVDDGGIDIIERARNLCGFDFLELEVLRVLRDILQRCLLLDAVLELQQAGFLEKEQGAAAVRRVIRDGNRSAILEVLEVFDLLGVDAHRLDVDAAGADELDLLVLFHEVLEIRVMLEEVGIEFLVVEGEVRLDIVVEFDDVELDAFLLEQRLGCLENLGVRHSRSAYFERLRAARLSCARRGRRRGLAAAAAGESQRRDDERSDECKYFFHVDSSL